MQPIRVEDVLDRQGYVHDTLERRAWTRIEIDDRVVGELDRLDARVPWIHGDGAELHEIEQRGQVTADETVLCLEPFVRGRGDSYACRRIRRCLLLIECFSANAIREPLHDERPIHDRGE